MFMDFVQCHSRPLSRRLNRCDRVILLDTVFQFQQVDENDILNIINNLTPKTSSGIDNLSIKHIKVIKYELAKPLTLITNQVLSSGIFPDKLKIAKVTPIFKKEMTQTLTTIDQYHYYLPSLK